MLQRLKIQQNLAHKLQLKLVGKIKVAEFLSIPENDFELYVRQVEKDPLFINLKEKYRIITYRKFYDVRYKKVPEIRDNNMVKNETGMGEFFPDQSVLDLLKKIGETVGEESFKKILDGRISIKEVIRRCNLSLPEEKVFQDFLNNFHLQQIVNPSCSAFSPPRSRFFLIASFEWEKDELFIRPLKEESYLVKGRYQINYDKFGELISKREIKKEQINKIEEIFKKLEMINRRTTTIYRILRYLKELQRPFFKSGNLIDLLPSSQSEVARSLGVHPSTVSRALFGKSILTPQGDERSLKFFFSRRWTGNLIKKVILREKQKATQGFYSPLTDELIREKIIEDYGINLSRRTVSKYRKALKIPPSYLRRRQAHL